MDPDDDILQLDSLTSSINNRLDHIQEFIRSDDSDVNIEVPVGPGSMFARASQVGISSGVAIVGGVGLLGGGLSSLRSGVGLSSLRSGVVGGGLGSIAGAGIASATGKDKKTGSLIGSGVGAVAGLAGEFLTRKPVVMPPDTLKVIQQDTKGTGKLRPKFIAPSVGILEKSEQQVQADQDIWNIFDFVNPTSEGSNGTAATNPLKFQALQEDEIRYRDAGIDVTMEYNDPLPYNEDHIRNILLGPELPEMQFLDNHEFEEFGDYQKFPYNASSQSHAIEILSEFRHFTNVTQLDEDINKSVLYGSIPMPFPSIV